jgi:hypothetical protein
MPETYGRIPCIFCMCCLVQCARPSLLSKIKKDTLSNLSNLALKCISELRNEGNNHFAIVPFGAIQEPRVQGI